MAGLGIIIPRAGSGPVVPDTDSRLHSGSLLLLDVMHSSAPLAAGVPADASLIPNIAHTQAAAAIGGSPTEAALAGIFKTNALTGSVGLLERSSKGGIHAIVTQGTLALSAGGAAILVPTAIRQYMFDNPTHGIYMSQWTNRTRAQTLTTGTTNFKFAISASSSALANYKLGHVSLGSQSERPTSASGTFLGKRTGVSGNEVGSQFVNSASNGWTGTAPTSLATLSAYGFNVGSPLTSPTTNRQASGFSSEIFYACYIEDLTVSGRTYAEVDALDQAAFTAAFGTGGRYNGDTYTAPSTIA
ncbi:MULTISPECIES: hypothetical protein [unclassified Rhodococcus (in: high G+C Gram-positive bacteria)]|uniref:hypothetical protein n=1 Tax=unclassified Rhodococcus (in: high G+C Gram-positive bacteria) TaxID=192944 RepID=UPI0007BBA9BE|nr:MULTISPECIES: hypothetical protein [unclassified Rhodococcus (in: high G+C Gram-positive bacteria)]KZF01650.1 hypothetical protein A2J02_26875 [Rhodococcus sp. EPR-147]KZF04801.1 hypothetical protein A2J04_05570 [Rhodococcus sp. EPR-279]